MTEEIKTEIQRVLDTAIRSKLVAVVKNNDSPIVAVINPKTDSVTDFIDTLLKAVREDESMDAELTIEKAQSFEYDYELNVSIKFEDDDNGDTYTKSYEVILATLY